VDSVPIGVAGRLDVSGILPSGDGMTWYLTGNVAHHIVTSNAELEIQVGGYYPFGEAYRIEASNTTTIGCGLDLALDLNPEGTWAVLIGVGYTWDLTDQDASLMGQNLPIESGLEGYRFGVGLQVKTQ